MIKKFEKNTKGRDFVCGDIHGCFTDLENELSKIGFDELKDRLFSVGDLADRGPESFRAIDFIKKPWFHPVLGNHEEMFLQCWVHRNEPVMWHYINGGEWVKDLSFEQLEEYKKEVEKLPLIIVVGNVLVCHSMLPDTDFETIEKNIGSLKDFIIWARDETFSGGAHGFVTYAGHTIHKDIVRYGNIIDIDTGAFLKYWDQEDGHLTVVEITNQE